MPKFTFQRDIQSYLLDDYPNSLAFPEMHAVKPERWHAVPTRLIHFFNVGRKEFWIRAVIPPGGAGEERQMIAELGYTFLREVDFHLERNGVVVRQGHSGMDRPQVRGHLPGTGHTLAFNHEPLLGEVLYIRVASEGLMLAPLILADQHEFHSFACFRYLLFGLFAGALLLIALHFLFLYLVLRDRLYPAFVGGLVALLVFMCEYSNVGYSKLLPFDDHFALSVKLCLELLCIIIALFSWANIEILNLRKNFPFFGWLSRGCIYYFIACGMITPWIQVYYADIFIMSGLTLIGVISGVLGMRLLPYDEAYFPFIGVVGLATCVLIEGASNFGLLQQWIPWAAAEFSENMGYVGAIWLAVLIAISLAIRIKAMQRERTEIIAALRSDSGHRLADLLGASYANQFETGRMTLTIMFIDVVGFSRVADMVGSERVFEQLASRLGQISRVVHNRGGVVDRSVGDGVLCFFGNSAAHPRHAVEAFLAAQDIQEEIAAAAQTWTTKESLLLPVRIGINTAEVTIGNLGSQERVDFSIIGGGVNFASRLQAACSPFRVILSETTRDQIADKHVQVQACSEIYIAVKHQAGLVKAYEFDPFVARADLVQAAERHYHELLGLSRQSDQRHALPKASDIYLQASVGRFKVVNFSRNGFGAMGEVFIGQHATIALEFATEQRELMAALKTKMLHRLEAEVRWSRRVAAGYLHGFKLVGLSDEQREYLFRLLCDQVGNDKVEAAFPEMRLRA